MYKIFQTPSTSVDGPSRLIGNVETLEEARYIMTKMYNLCVEQGFAAANNQAEMKVRYRYLRFIFLEKKT